MRAFIARALFVVSTFAFAGCAVQSQPEDAEGTEESQAELTKLAAKYVGTWNQDSTATDTVRFYSQLKLGADASYSALVAPVCAKGKPCPMYLVTETGTWKVTSSGTLTLKSDLGKKSVYGSSLSGDGFGMKLFAASGHELLVRDARVGETCGGFVRNPKHCEEGLVCFGLGMIADKPGTCMKPVAEGGSCGFRTQSKPCADGLECRWNGGPLDALKCSAPATAEGKFCGGIAGIACPDGYGCTLDGTYPDAGGKCHACVIIDCAAPPAGCAYVDTTPAGACRTSCGKLTCDGSSL